MGGDLSIVSRNIGSGCAMCGHRTDLFVLPGRRERLCLACSADLAIVAVLRTEIDAATFAGQDAEGLADEFAEYSRQLLTRAQSADALESW